MYSKWFGKIKVGDELYVRCRKLYSDEEDIRMDVCKVISINNNVIDFGGFSFKVDDMKASKQTLDLNDHDYAIFTTKTEYVADTKKLLESCIQYYTEKIQRLKSISYNLNYLSEWK